MAAYSSRDIIEGYMRYKLLDGGVAWRFPPHSSQRGILSPLPWRSEEGLALDHLQQALPRLLAALQSASDELEGLYHNDLQAQVAALQLQREISGGAALRSLTLIRDEMFRDGVNWGRIVAMMALGGALSTEAARMGETGQVDDIADWMEESLESSTLRGWIQNNGGWDAFVELYESRPPVTFWTLSTVFGLVVLGAAFITLGVLFAQR
ncbi:apoptosis regulator Bcl-2-like [Girardinichthys multiradiatus]|uniref:apoptosis regulator Bcl-2-like n=1 Tax=Girardinichthys multiradiatus TaxID=208333 RepID=UPI001FADC621|nr:apoptosis regulator Bcl-2-like [Girardinichthys multiradiatus]